MGVNPLTQTQFSQAATTLKNAFADYTLNNLYCGRGPSADEMLNYLTKAVPAGHGFVSSSQIEGVAIWFGPNQQPLPPNKHLTLDTNSRAEINMQAFGLFSEAQRQFHLPVPHWYLSVVGIDPAHQGKGIARKLLAPILEKADQQQVPCYLDTHTTVNVEIYQRLGFHVAEETTVPGGKLTHWSMVRVPQLN